ncbi:MAG: hypothetical protein CMP95_03980 [Gammaproteobacteria bacterium]|nr:hypothetical protein [Gammaproteobacteria bacterium]
MKILIFILTLTGSSMVWAECVSGNCKNGIGILNGKEVGNVLGLQETYTGGFRHGKFHGKAIITSPDGAKYVGGFRNGKFHGKAIITYPDGDYYVGEFLNGEPQSKEKEIQTSPDGDIYVVELLDGEVIAYGEILVSADGKKDVLWKPKGEQTIIGTSTWASGDKYVGEFESRYGELTGTGTFTSASGDKYVGEFLDGERTGTGTFTSASGDKYVGEWRDGNQIGKELLATEKEALVIQKEVFAIEKETLVIQKEVSTIEKEVSAREEAIKEEISAIEKEVSAIEEAIAEAIEKYDRIYNACLLEKSSGVDMQVSSLRKAVEDTCVAIAAEPSWYQEWKYD